MGRRKEVEDRFLIDVKNVSTDFYLEHVSYDLSYDDIRTDAHLDGTGSER